MAVSRWSRGENSGTLRGTVKVVGEPGEQI